MTPSPIFVVWRNWFDDIEVVEAFETDADAQQFVAKMRKRSGWHYHVDSVPLSPSGALT